MCFIDWTTVYYTDVWVYGDGAGKSSTDCFILMNYLYDSEQQDMCMETYNQYLGSDYYEG